MYTSTLRSIPIVIVIKQRLINILPTHHFTGSIGQIIEQIKFIGRKLNNAFSQPDLPAICIHQQIPHPHLL